MQNEDFFRVVDGIRGTEHEPIVYDFLTLQQKAAITFIRKQMDYGPGNIAKFGFAGVLVRLNDKMERLMHLTTSGQEPQNESIEDTLIDIANYAIIGLMCLRGEWPNAQKYRLTKSDIREQYMDHRKLVETLYDLALDACSDGAGNGDSSGRGACANALRLLAELKLFKIEKEYGKRIIGKFQQFNEDHPNT